MLDILDDIPFDEGFLVISDEEDEELRRLIEERNFLDPDNELLDEYFDEEDLEDEPREGW